MFFNQNIMKKVLLFSVVMIISFIGCKKDTIRHRMVNEKWVINDRTAGSSSPNWTFSLGDTFNFVDNGLLFITPSFTNVTEEWYWNLDENNYSYYISMGESSSNFDNYVHLEVEKDRMSFREDEYNSNSNNWYYLVPVD